MANKTKQALLDAYKKASKPSRLVIIGRAGCISEEEYFKYLDTLPSTSLFKTKEEKEAEKAGKTAEDQKLDMVIAFDTTGSMGTYIAAVRAHVTTLIPKLFEENKDLRLKIVAFGDYCDMRGRNGEFGLAYQESPLTDDINTLVNFVTRAQNTGGGDSDEFYELVIKKVTEETPWRIGAKKAVLLIADCDPHPVGYSYGSVVRNSQIDWKEEARKSAALGIQWDTLSCGTTAVHTFYKPLSEMTGGINIPFQSSEKTQEVMYASTSARGGLKSKAAFRASYAAAVSSGDAELAGSYKSLSSLLDD